MNDKHNHSPWNQPPKRQLTFIIATYDVLIISNYCVITVTLYSLNIVVLPHALGSNHNVFERDIY